MHVDQKLYDVEFYSDGTPVLKAYLGEHLIRRNGIWYTMHLAGGFQDVEASCIKDDTLFVYEENVFAYSLNKGQSFTTVFTYGESIIDHSANLWKFENYFVLHHTAGNSDYISIFNKQGQRVLFEPMDIYARVMTYNTCGEILFADYDRYFLLKEQGLILTSGKATDIFSDFSYTTDLFAVDDNYYLREGNTMYKKDESSFL